MHMSAIIDIPGDTRSYPRPKAEYLEQRLPIPWISARSISMHPEDGWALFDTGKDQLTIDSCLCTVCGEQLPKRKLYAVTGTFTDKKVEPAGVEHYMTAGTGLHARCAVLSAIYCPKLCPDKELSSEQRQSALDDLFVELECDDNGLTEEGVEHFLDMGAEVIIAAGAQPISWEKVQKLAREEARNARRNRDT
jgi:hypothetical protein